MNNPNKDLSKQDLEIMERLAKLKDGGSKEPIPTDAEIRKRLALLRNEPEASNSKSNLPKVVKKTDQEQCDDLLKQYMEECKIETNRNSIDDVIKKRLDNLKDTPNDTIFVIPENESKISQSDAITRAIQEAMLAPSDDELSDNSNIEPSSDELSYSEDDEDDSY